MVVQLPKLNKISRSLKSVLKSRLSEFFTNKSGAIAVVFGIALIPVMLSAGIAVDYSRISLTKGVVDEALDAAVLMSGRALSQGSTPNAAFRQEFEDFFFANIAARTNLASDVSIATFRADPRTGKVTATVVTELKMAFMGIIGKPTIDISSQSEASYATSKVELTMMLDVTGSMRRQGKLAALKAAANSAIDILMPASTGSSTVRIALVPYSASVNVGSSLASQVSNNPGNKCVTERDANRFNDASYAVTKVEGRTTNCPSQKVVPLSSVPGPLKSTINSFTASGYTAGHLGVAWSYYTLSPNWSSAWSASSSPAEYNEPDVKKIALLMTDGEFNTIYTNGWSSSSFAISTCANMKSRGITVYSVAFKAPTSARTTLRACATPDTAETAYYYSAESSAGLAAAFTNIANDIKRLRLSM